MTPMKNIHPDIIGSFKLIARSTDAEEAMNRFATFSRLLEDSDIEPDKVASLLAYFRDNWFCERWLLAILDGVRIGHTNITTNNGLERSWRDLDEVFFLIEKP